MVFLLGYAFFQLRVFSESGLPTRRVICLQERRVNFWIIEPDMLLYLKVLGMLMELLQALDLVKMMPMMLLVLVMHHPPRRMGMVLLL